MSEHHTQRQQRAGKVGLENRSGLGNEYAILTSKMPTLVPEYAEDSVHGTGSVEWSRDHLIHFHGWTPERVEREGKFAGDTHGEEHANGDTLPVPHEHLDPSRVKSLRRLFGSVELLAGDVQSTNGIPTDGTITYAHEALAKVLAVIHGNG